MTTMRMMRMRMTRRKRRTMMMMMRRALRRDKLAEEGQLKSKGFFCFVFYKTGGNIAANVTAVQH